ncbi:hypothetical protein [Roseobacter weihaiensis]|uniref:hypothetical protein n=1 Tax=Roseobacter weihaiensis TaxID=2763262 RepID=UPI001D0B0FAF|nr:hypothetical protein [Roseobacter sp. H9]
MTGRQKTNFKLSPHQKEFARGLGSHKPSLDPFGSVDAQPPAAGVASMARGYVSAFDSVLGKAGEEAAHKIGGLADRLVANDLQRQYENVPANRIVEIVSRYVDERYKIGDLQSLLGITVHLPSSPVDDPTAYPDLHRDLLKENLARGGGLPDYQDVDRGSNKKTIQ